MARFSTALVLSLGLAGPLVAADRTPLTTGRPEVRSLSSLPFGSEGVLFVGDGKGGAVFAIDLGPREVKEPKEVADLEGKIAALLGAAASDVTIHDLAVDPISKQPYLAVSRGRAAWNMQWLLPNDVADANVLVRLEESVAQAPTPTPAATPPLPSPERGAFTFLVGSWTLHERRDLVKGTTERGDDSYEFVEGPGGSLVSTWRFNRRTTANPDYANARYISGFNNSTQAWSFYYVSEQSAQYWPGAKVDGVWYFTYETIVDGKPWKQKQWWTPDGPDRVQRHFANWDFDTKTYKELLTTVLVRRR